MPGRTRAVDRGSRRADVALTVVADEFRTHRLAAGLRQADIARSAGISRSVYSRIESAKRRHLSIRDAMRLAAVLGLDLSVRLFPNGDPLRDAGQLRVIEELRAMLASPLRLRTEVPLPRLDDRAELRAWDGELTGGGMRTTVEVETRLVDAQAQARRLALKLRDDPPDRLLLVVADSRANRRILRLHPELWPDLPRLRRHAVVSALRKGRHPPSGLVRLSATALAPRR